MLSATINVNHYAVKENDRLVPYMCEVGSHGMHVVMLDSMYDTNYRVPVVYHRGAYQPTNKAKHNSSWAHVIDRAPSK